jgi:hypothetical protein
MGGMFVKGGESEASHLFGDAGAIEMRSSVEGVNGLPGRDVAGEPAAKVHFGGG